MVCGAMVARAQMLTPRQDDKKGRWGYVDSSKEWIIKPKWDEAREFFNTPGIGPRAIVRSKDKYNLIDERGKNVGDSYQAMQLVDGEKLLLIKDGKRWGAMDLEGRKTMKAAYDSLVPLGHSAFMAQQKGLWGIVNTYGDVIHKIEYSDVTPMANGDLMARFHGQTCVIGRSGHDVILPGRYTAIEPLPDGNYIVTGSTGRKGIANAGGMETVRPAYSTILPIGIDGLLAVEDTGGKGLMSTSGTILYPAKLNDLKMLTPDRILITRMGKQGMLDAAGHTIVEPRDYLELELRPDGYIATRSGAGRGLLTPAGKMMVKAGVDEVGPVKAAGSVNYVATRHGDKWGYATDGGVAVEPMLDEAPEFGADGTAKVKYRGALTLASTDGKHPVDVPVRLNDALLMHKLSDGALITDNGLTPLDFAGKEMTISVHGKLVFIHPADEEEGLVYGNNGRPVSDRKYVYVGTFDRCPKYALAAVSTDDGYRWGVLDAEGRSKTDFSVGAGSEAIDAMKGTDDVTDEDLVNLDADYVADMPLASDFLNSIMPEIDDEPEDVVEEVVETPDVVFDNVWIDHNVYNQGRKGMMIHIRMDVNGYRGREIHVAAYFKNTKTGKQLVDKDGRYKSVSGNVSVGERTTVRYDSSHWDDFRLFMPYDQFHITSGKANIDCWVEVFYNSRSLGSSWTVNLNYDSGKPAAPAKKRR